MLVYRLPSPAQPSGEGKTETSAPVQRLARWARRGVTMMEYLVCLSFIIAVLVLAVQHIGGTTGTIFQNDADAVPGGSAR